MGGSSKETNTTNTVDPWAKGMFNQGWTQTQNLLNTPVTPYTGQLAAPLNPLQTQAASMALGNVGAGQGLLSQGASGASAGASYSPQQVKAGLLANTNLTPYENPFQNDVINTTMNQLDLQRQRDLNNQGSQFTANGAFGGARQGVADSLTNEAYGNIAAQTLAGLNSQNFSQAQAAAQGDIANQLQVAEANQGAGLQGAGLNLQASGLLGSLAGEQQQLGANDAQLVNSFGQQAQQTQQNQDTAAYQEFLRQQQYPWLQQQALTSFLGTVPVTTNSKSTSTYNPSIMSDIGAGLNILSNPLLFSDARVKENVQTVGIDGHGRRWVAYTYKGEKPGAAKRLGVIAQEILQTDPHAVSQDPATGLYLVDYGALGRRNGNAAPGKSPPASSPQALRGLLAEAAPQAIGGLLDTATIMPGKAA